MKKIIFGDKIFIFNNEFKFTKMSITKRKKKLETLEQLFSYFTVDIKGLINYIFGLRPAHL